MVRRSSVNASSFARLAGRIARVRGSGRDRSAVNFRSESLERRLMLATVHGVKFEDLDADGIQDAGEGGLAGWTIYADDNQNGGLDAGEPQSVTQPGTGAYSLTLPGGPPRFPIDHTISEVQQPGWRATTPLGGSEIVTLILTSNVTLNFGNVQVGTVSGTVFNDQDGDGVRGSEPALRGETVYVDSNGNGVLDNEPATVTDLSGNYSIELPVSSVPYILRLGPAAGWRQTFPGPPHAPAGQTVLLDNPSGPITGRDFGATQLGLISGQTIQDLDGDRVRDPEDTPLPGGTIFIDLDHDTVLDAGEPSAITGDDGRYWFNVSGVPAVTYDLFEVFRPGLRQTFPGRGVVRRVLFDGNGQVRDGVDFLSSRTILVVGTKFNDIDGDGERDVDAQNFYTDPGLAGWTIYHDANDNDVLDAGEINVVTGPDGQYALVLPAPESPRPFTIREVFQGGWRQTLPGLPGQERTFNFGPGGFGSVDFGNSRTARISGTVFEDDNGNTLRDDNEGPHELSFVFVDFNDNARADDGNGALTDAQGHYSITLNDVPTGPAEIRLNFIGEGSGVGTLPMGGVYLRDLAPGVVISDLDFGVATPGVVGGRHFHDLDADGVQDAGEPLLEGWRVYWDANLNGRFDSTEASPPRIDASDGLPRSTVNSATVRSRIYVSGQNPVLRDLDVRLNMTHPTVGDLNVYLISPRGRRVALTLAAGATSDNITNVTFDDEATQAITTATPPFANQSLRPREALSVFDGEDPNGQWTLEVFDLAPQNGASLDIGSLDSWSLLVASAETNVLTPSTTASYVLVVPSGFNRNIRLEPRAGWVMTSPASGYHNRDVAFVGGVLPNSGFGVVQGGSISGRQFLDADGDGVFDAGETGVGGVSIYRDLDDDGQFNSAHTQLQGFSSFLPDAVDSPQGVLPRVFNTFTAVFGVSGRVQDVDVTVDIDHARVSDLTLRLIGPAGQVVTLVDRPAAPGANFDSTVFDNTAPLSIAGGAPPYTGRFRPVEPLESLNDGPVNGIWRLVVVDHVPGHSGQLNGWSLDITHGDPVRVTSPDSNFAYSFPGLLPVGFHVIRQAMPEPTEEWNQTAPPSGAHRVSLAMGQNLVGADFGNRRLSGGGVRAIYYDHEFFAGRPLFQSPVPSTGQFGVRSPDVRIAPDQFSAIFEGELEVLANDSYSFYVGSDDGIDLTLLDPGSGQVLLQGPPRGIYVRRGFTPFQDRVGTVQLESGKRYLIQWRFDEEFGGAAYGVGWQRGGGPIEAIPGSALRPPTLPPATPRNVRALAPPLCPGHVIISFKDVSLSETFFEVQRSANVNGPFTTLSNLTRAASNDLGGEIWIDDEPPGLDTGQAWFYRVRALGRTAADHSAYSAAVAVTPGEGGTGQVVNGTAVVLPGPDGNVDEVADNVLRLTDNQQSQTGSWFLTAPRAVAGSDGALTAAFDFVIPQHTAVPADGFAFVIQRAGADALAVSGGGLGYMGMPRSLALKFDLYRGVGGVAMNQVGFYANGYMDDTFGTDAAVDLANGHTYRVTVNSFPAFSGIAVGVFDLTADPSATAPVFSSMFFAAGIATGNVSLNIPQVLGGDCALFGFTGATGGLSAVQMISNFRLNGEAIPFDLALNDAPVNAVPAPQSRAKDQSLVFSAASGNAIVISDTDARGGDVRVTLAAPAGLLTLSGVGGLVFESGDGAADSTMVFRGTLSAVNAALAGLRFEAVGADAIGRIDQVTLTTDDLGHSGAGGPLSDSDTITITAVRGEPGPTVVAVYLSGSRWTTAFISALVNLGLGASRYGFAVSGGDHLNEIPWAGIDRVSIQFDSAVDVDADDLGVRGAAGNHPVTGFTYEPLDRTATWTLGRAVRLDRLMLDLDAGPGGVRADVGVAPLDGEWDNGADSFPSGDGGGGGDFRFAVNLLAGDVDRDGRVTALDVLDVRRRLRRSAADPGAGTTAYTVFHDVTADGATGVMDVEAIRRNLLTTLPPAAPVRQANTGFRPAVTRDLFGSRPIL